jgi:hypothetical protein
MSRRRRVIVREAAGRPLRASRATIVGNRYGGAQTDQVERDHRAFLGGTGRFLGSVVVLVALPLVHLVRCRGSLRSRQRLLAPADDHS